MEQENKKKINVDELEWYYKKYFKDWEMLASNEKNKRKTFMGLKGGDNLNTKVVIKQMNLEKKPYVNILKEVYFLSSVVNNRYFIDIIDVFISKDNKYVFIITNEAGTDLRDDIVSQKIYDKLNMPDIPRYLIFNVVCGLKFLHDNNITHNDIKPGNIVTEGKVNIKICDMGSSDRINMMKFYGTNGYRSPQILLGKKNTKSDDMWAVGVVFLELLNKKVNLFKFGGELSNLEIGKEKLKDILAKYYDVKGKNDSDWNQMPHLNIVINYIEKDKYDDSFEFRLKPNLDIFSKLDKADKELIEGLLEINPKKRMNVNDVIKSPIFNNYFFENSEFDYKIEDYDKYLKQINIDENLFKTYLEAIREKFIDKVIFGVNKI